MVLIAVELDGKPMVISPLNDEVDASPRDRNLSSEAVTEFDDALAKRPLESRFAPLQNVMGWSDLSVAHRGSEVLDHRELEVAGLQVGGGNRPDKDYSIARPGQRDIEALRENARRLRTGGPRAGDHT